ncbi:hypothetical protein H7B90_12380 [Cohnella xylanilytica]|uniref:Uncharacterized protein n=1 Tax=Cohnella xylanilytica TaxID=557555 RepID=A0A841TX64_9BACL|nr:hypothetical protein [Cohnella xylanilytica]MBB6692199.1 hypothetical protein [Cohnella xylanilytica]
MGIAYNPIQILIFESQLHSMLMSQHIEAMVRECGQQLGKILIELLEACRPNNQSIKGTLIFHS